MTRGGRTKGVLKQNQDRLSVLENEQVFTVCDGHGIFGHCVSDWYIREIPKALSKFINFEKQKEKPSSTYQVKSSLIKGLNNARIALSDSGIDMRLSGTTCNMCYINDKKVFCVNIGDSRSVIYSRTG